MRMKRPCPMEQVFNGDDIMTCRLVVVPLVKSVIALAEWNVKWINWEVAGEWLTVHR
jgi:hypothetical protein